MAKCFVTGADGFIGSHLCEALRDAGHDVTGMAQYNGFGDYHWLGLIPGVEKVMGDVRDAEQMRRFIQAQDYVFHLAALVDVAESIKNPRPCYDTNLYGTLNVLAAVRDANAKMVHTSSSEVYGSALFKPMDEAHPINPQSPYAASKNAADGAVRAAYLCYGLPAVIIRPFNTYGPRQSDRAVIAKICMAAADPKQDKIVLGDLSPKRDFMYVTDTAKAFMAVMDLDFGVYNAGTGESVKIGALPSYVTSKPVVSKHELFRPEAAEVQELRCNANKLYGATQWMAEIPLFEGMKKTLAWYRDTDS